MNPTSVAKTENHQQLFVKNRLVASVSDNTLPDRIEIIRAGQWEGSWKGDLVITIADLIEMKLNFDRGMGLPGGGSAGAPIDFSHEEWSQAAGWIKALEVDEVNGILYASEMEWTTAGQEAIEGGMFKFFSPSVYPACLGQWYDPEDPTVTARNVLLGGGLTNIPFFKSLTGLKASRSPQTDGKENVIYLSKEEGEDMIVKDIIAKDPSTLSAEEKTFLGEHKDELSAEQQIAFGIVETPTPADPPAPTPSDVLNNEDPTPTPANAEAVALQASISAGTHVVIEKDQLTKLQASAQASESKLAAMEKKETEARVDAAVHAGKIKSDQRDKWVGRIIADATILEDLESLPENKVLATELGSAAQDGSAVAQMNAKITAAQTEHKDLSYADAVSKVRKENPELREAYDKEIKTK